MPPRGVKKGTKRARQYERIKESQLDRGTGERPRRRSRRGQSTRSGSGGGVGVTSASSVRDISSSRRGGLRSGTNRAKGRTRDQLYNEARQLESRVART